jgi:hypothetical protein
MIGDYFSKMATAEKMSPQQLDQSVKDGVLTQDMAQNVMPTPAQPGIQGLQQPPIAQQVMQQADQMIAPEQIKQKINELKDVIAQVHQGVQSGEIEAYKGIPYIKEQLDKIQELQAQIPKQGIDTAPQLAQAAPQEAPQQAPQGIDAAPSNLPTQMAQGGILGFATGGMDDDEEDRELEQLYGSGTDNDLIQAIAAAGGGRSVHPSAAIQMEPMPKETTAKGKHKYEDLVIKEAQRQGLDPAIAVHALYKETGNLANPETAMSKAGAYGPMQLMAGTAKQMGVDRMDPIQNIQGGVGYLKQMYDKYQDPSLTLMAYNAGPGRVDRALKSDKGIAALPSETRKYVNMASGGIAHFASHGLVDIPSEVAQGNDLLSNYLSEDANKNAQYYKDIAKENKSLLEKAPPPSAKELARQQLGIETTGIPSALRRGNQSLTSSLAQYQPNINAPASEKNSSSVSNDFKNLINLVGQSDGQPPVSPDATNFGVTNTAWDNGKPTAAPAAPPAAAPASPMSISDPSQVGPQYSLSKPSSVAPTDNAGIASAPAATSPTSDPFIASLMNKISGREAESKKNAETNKYLALLQGAFKTMGGKSQYALENIGAGGESAVGTYAALNQATQKEQADLMNQQLGLYKYQSAADIGRKRNELAERELGEKPTLADNLQVKADTALNRNPQYISLSKGLEKEREAGTLTPEKEQRYLSNMEMITKNTYSNFGVPYKSSTVKLPPIETPAAPKPKGFFENMFSGSSPTPTVSTISPERSAELSSKYGI